MQPPGVLPARDYDSRSVPTMSTDDDTDDEPVVPDEETYSLFAEAVAVTSKGKITIPSRLRDRYGIDPDDVVDIVVDTGEVSFGATDIVVQSDGRIRIPERKRTLYGIEDGDTLDIEVHLTGLTYPDGE